MLILHLKRFEYIPGQYFMHRQKIDALVEFPLHGLDLAALVQGGGGDRAVYDLFAISEHLGGLGGGHYTVKQPQRKNGDTKQGRFCASSANLLSVKISTNPYGCVFFGWICLPKLHPSLASSPSFTPAFRPARILLPLPARVFRRW